VGLDGSSHLSMSSPRTSCVPGSGPSSSSSFTAWSWKAFAPPRNQNQGARRERETGSAAGQRLLGGPSGERVGHDPGQS